MLAVPPSSTYDSTARESALAAAPTLRHLLQLDGPSIGERGRSFFLLPARPSGRAALLLHGLTASPGQMERFASGLAERGYAVLVPRLPRHGRSDRLTRELAELDATELLERTKLALQAARELAPRITVVGFSLGGTLALRLAHDEDLERAVAIAPFLGFAWLPNRIAPLLARAILRLPNAFAWWDPIAREAQMPAHGYPRYSTHAVARAYGLANALLADARESAPRTHDIVAVSNDREAAVNNRAIRRLLAAWVASGASGVRNERLRGLPISHDIVEPERHPEIADRVFPQLLQIVSEP
ncbi:MAG: alpha/beta hydrolase [Candidatus Eremiobacteraeota bacterium]|nr:alpha/beta fold hydrolase [Candidatus Eremiobacteraeota bacterium]NNM91844.1 alpha/beta hydrolase [Candidatus Eremiobacteraeota bacterium]